MIAILGIGQSLRGDDAAGLKAVEHWQSLYPASANTPDVRVELLELPGLALLDYLEGAQQVLLVDAVRSGAAPGNLHLLCEAELAAFATGSGSAHGWGVAEALALGRKMYPEKMPALVDILGSAAGDVSLGEALSAGVQAALDPAAAMIAAWLDEKE